MICQHPKGLTKREILEISRKEKLRLPRDPSQLNAILKSLEGKGYIYHGEEIEKGNAFRYFQSKNVRFNSERVTEKKMYQEVPVCRIHG